MTIRSALGSFAAIAGELVRDCRWPCRRTSSRRTAKNSFGSICPKRSSTPRSPKSGEQEEKIAPSEAAASMTATSPACSAASRRRGRRRRRPPPASPAAGATRARASSSQLSRRSTLSSPRKTIAVAVAGCRRRFSAKFSRASGKKRASRIAGAVDEAALALLADDPAEIPDEVPEGCRIARPTRRAARHSRRNPRPARRAGLCRGIPRSGAPRSDRGSGVQSGRVFHRRSAPRSDRVKHCHSARNAPSGEPVDAACTAGKLIAGRRKDAGGMKRIAWILAAVASGRRCALRAVSGAGAARGSEGADRRADRKPGRAETCRSAASRRSASSPSSASRSTTCMSAGRTAWQDAEIMSMDRLDGHDPPAAARDRPDRGRLLSRWCARSCGWCATTRAERNWDFDSGAAALQLAFAGDVPLGDFSHRGRHRHLRETASPAIPSGSIRSTLAIEWPSVRQPLCRRGDGNLARRAGHCFRRAPTAPFEFMNGGATPLGGAHRIGADRRDLHAAQADDYPRRPG